MTGTGCRVLLCLYPANDKQRLCKVSITHCQHDRQSHIQLLSGKTAQFSNWIAVMTDFSELGGRFTLKGRLNNIAEGWKRCFRLWERLLQHSCTSRWPLGRDACLEPPLAPVTCWLSHDIHDAQSLDGGQEAKSGYDRDGGDESVNMLDVNGRSSVYWLDIFWSTRVFLALYRIEWW